MSLPLIISAIVFLVIFGGAMTAYAYLEEKYWRAVLSRRLYGDTLQAETMATRLHGPWMHRVRQLGQGTVPKNESAVAEIRRQLSYAGYRDPQAVVLYYGVRVGLCLILGIFFLLVVLLTGHFRIENLIPVFLPTAVGYYLPVLLLRIRVRSRQRQIFRELPDTLDLVLICLEAGLGFDPAMYRVSRELAKVSPIMAEEFGRYYLEIRSGLPRKTVLNNLAERNGVESLTSVVGVLVQSIHFGTNVAESLSVHIRSMRTQRRQIAEEKGAKMSTRMTFPMIMLILPALFLIILGPALINIYERIKGGF